MPNPGVKGLRKIQLAREVTPGTPPAGVGSIWLGSGVIQDDTKNEFATNQTVGILAGTDRAYQPMVGGTLELEDTPMNPQQILHLCEMGIMTASPTGVGPYVYTYNLPTTAQPTIKTYTIEGGDDAQAERMSYCYAEKLNFKGQANGVWTMGGTVKGRQVANNAFTSAPALVTVEDLVFNKSKLYIDEPGGTIGTTQITGALVSAEISVDTGWRSYQTADGQMYYSGVKNVGPVVEVSLTYEHIAAAVTEKGKMRAGTSRLIRIQAEGANAANAKIVFDMAGQYINFEKLGDRNGNDIVVAKFRALYNATAALFAKIVVTNQVSSVP